MKLNFVSREKICQIFTIKILIKIKISPASGGCAPRTPHFRWCCSKYGEFRQTTKYLLQRIFLNTYEIGFDTTVFRILRNPLSSLPAGVRDYVFVPLTSSSTLPPPSNQKVCYATGWLYYIFLWFFCYFIINYLFLASNFASLFSIFYFHFKSYFLLSPLSVDSHHGFFSSLIH